MIPPGKLGGSKIMYVMTRMIAGDQGVNQPEVFLRAGCRIIPDYSNGRQER
jgi:hypothetical protein